MLTYLAPLSTLSITILNFNVAFPAKKSCSCRGVPFRWYRFKSCNSLLRIRATNKKWCWTFFFSDQWGVLAPQTVWINSRSSVAPRSSGCSRTVVAWRRALLSCQNPEVQVFGWSHGQMESVTAYSKHLVWLTRRTTHLFSLFPIPQPIASILVLSHHLNPAPRLFSLKELFIVLWLLRLLCFCPRSPDRRVPAARHEVDLLPRQICGRSEVT